MRYYGPLFFSACEQLFRQPLHKYIREGRIDLLIWTDDFDSMLDYLTVASTCGYLPNTKLRISLCSEHIGAWKEMLVQDLPMFQRMFDRADTADLTFESVPPAVFPEYVICAPEFAARVPQGCCCVEMREEPLSAELLRLAENLNYTFAISYGSREPINKISGDMKKRNYEFASSVLQAAHLPAKLFCAGVDADDPAAAVKYTQALERDSKLLNRLVWLEHARWSVFMALSGWNFPTCEEMAEYAFVENPDGSMITEFRHRGRRLHPSLAECSPDGVDVLENRSEYWDQYDPSLPEYAGLDELSRISLWQHRYAMLRANEHLAEIGKILKNIKRENPRMQGLNQLESEINRVANRESGAEYGLKRALHQAKGLVDEALLERIHRLMQSSIEASRRRSYLQGDIFSTKTVGAVLLFQKRFTSIIRCLTKIPQDNIGALLLLNPEKAAFIIDESDDMPQVERVERMNGVRTFVRIRNLRTELLFIRADGGMDAAVQEARAWAEDAVFDLTGAGAEFMFAAMGSGGSGVAVKNGRLLPAPGSDGSIAVMNTLPKTPLLVRDIFAAMNRETYEGWEIPDLSGLERIVTPAFEAFCDLTDKNPGVYSKLMKYFQSLPKSASVTLSNKTSAFDFSLPEPLALSRNVIGCLKCLELDKGVEALSYGVDAAGNYHFSGNSRCPALIDILSAPAQDYSCSVPKAQETNGNINVTMRITHNAFSGPESAELNGALERFAEAGCFERIDGGWKYASPGVRGMFSTAGNLLEDYIYHLLRLNPNYTDVQLGYQFGLNEKLEHEIDVVAVTKSNRPVMVSCKLGYESLKESAVDEIYRHGRMYSINSPIPVLATACTEEQLKKKGFDPNGKARKYMEALGVRLMDRETLRNPALLQKFFNEIAGA